MPDNNCDDLINLIDWDGVTFTLDNGFWVKFDIKMTATTKQRPYGIKYSITLHDHSGNRILGFDNSHQVKPLTTGYGGSRDAFDHWHRTTADKGIPYKFEGAEKLITDFFREVDKIITANPTIKPKGGG